MSIKKIISSTLAFSLLLSALFLVSCSGKKVMSVGESEVYVDKYEIEFFMSRTKGMLYGYGWDVSSSDIWGTIIDTSGVTVDEYYRTVTLQEVSKYAIAQYLFENKGLELTDSEKSGIDDTIDALIKYAGSKNQLNSVLSEYGVNVKILRRIYENELKMEKVKEFYFGTDGLGADDGKERAEQYLSDNYICFKQVFLATYGYKTEVDGDGETIYFTDEKYNKIAYDEKNGKPKVDVYAQSRYETDGNGDVIYYTSDGKIAYDETGYAKYILDDDGEKQIEYYDEAKIAEVKKQAEKLASGKLTVEEFEKLIYDYSELDGDENGKKVYIRSEEKYYESQSSSHKYLDEIAEKLKEADDGECVVVQSGAGFHIVYKYEVEEGIYTSEEYKDAFSTFNEDFVNMLFDELCEKYKDTVKLDEDIYDKIPHMKDVGVNILY